MKPIESGVYFGYTLTTFLWTNIRSQFSCLFVVVVLLCFVLNPRVLRIQLQCPEAWSSVYLEDWYIISPTHSRLGIFTGIVQKNTRTRSAHPPPTKPKTGFLKTNQKTRKRSGRWKSNCTQQIAPSYLSIEYLKYDYGDWEIKYWFIWI